MDQSILSKITSDDYVNAILHTSATRVGSDLHNAMCNVIVDQIKDSTEKNKKKKKIDVKRNLNEDQIQLLAELFPERRVVTSSVHRGTHSMAAAMRKIETDVIFTSFPKNGVIYDIGGNWATHAKRDDGGFVHCCCPILDFRDAQRKMTRLIDFNRFIDDAKVVSAEKAAVAAQIKKDCDLISENAKKDAYDANDLNGTWFCQNKFEDCVYDHSTLGDGKKEAYGMAIHSIYDIHLVDLVSAMERKKMRVLKGTFLFSADIIIGKKRGELPSVNGFYIIDGESIKYSFYDDPNCGYEHNLNSLMLYVTKTFVKAAGGAVYYLELTEMRGDTMFFTITDASEARVMGVSHDSSTKCLPLNKRDLVVFPLFDIDRATDELVFREELLSREFVNRALEYAFRLKDNQVTAEGLISYFASTNNAVVIGGSARKTSEKVDPKLLPMITTTLMVYQELQKAKQKRVLGKLKSKVKEELTLSGILESVVHRVFGSQSLYQRGLGVFAKWMQYSYGQDLVGIHDVPLYLEINDRIKLGSALKNVNGFSLSFSELDEKVSLYEEYERERQRISDEIVSEKIGLIGEGYVKVGESSLKPKQKVASRDGMAQWVSGECHLYNTMKCEEKPVEKPRRFSKVVLEEWISEGNCFALNNSFGDEVHWFDSLKEACGRAWRKQVSAVTFSDAEYFDNIENTENEELEEEEVIKTTEQVEQDWPIGNLPDVDPDDSASAQVCLTESASTSSDEDCDPMEQLIVAACERAFATKKFEEVTMDSQVVQSEEIEIVREGEHAHANLSSGESESSSQSQELVAVGSVPLSKWAQMVEDSEVRARQCAVDHDLSWDEVKYAKMPERPEEAEGDDFRTKAKREFLWYLKCKLVADKSTLVEIMRDFIYGQFHSGACETPKNACFLSYEKNVCGEWMFGKRYRHPSKGASSYAVRFTREDWKRAKLIKLQWKNAKAEENGEMSSDNSDKPIVPQGETGIYLFCDITFLMNEIPILNRLEISFKKRVQRRAPRITLVDGVPGCGKSTYVVKEANLVNQYVVTIGREAAEDLRERFKSERNATATQLKRVRTVDSYLLNDTQSRANVLHFDEALMAHAGMVYFCADDLSARSVICQGDSQQIPFINRVESITLRYSKLEIDNVVEKRLTYRSPLDVASYLTKKNFYGTSVVTSANPLVRSLKTVGPRDGMTSIYSIPKIPGTQYLTFLQSEKEEMRQYLGRGNWNVNTVHESQGKTYDNVVLCRLKATDNEIYPGGRNSSPYMVVGVTRHRRSLVYYTKAEDKLYFDLAEMLSVQEGKLMKHLHEEGVK
uniref:RNA-dependent RNA polymerase n=1 Tax=Potato mop-top virus TaxID=37128 RepID=A0A0X7YK04_9VIRU|nr:RNA-dependent RNA polymerase [Potato mop-top virus]